MTSANQSSYHVKRLVSGATGTNTINIYRPVGVDISCELEEPSSLDASFEIDSEQLVLETAFDIILEATIEVEPVESGTESALEPIVENPALPVLEPVVESHEQ
jgi:hypothetical protein